MQTIYCIIWNKNNTWELFTNQVFVLVEWKVADAAEWF